MIKKRKINVDDDDKNDDKYKFKLKIIKFGKDDKMKNKLNNIKNELVNIIGKQAEIINFD